MCSSARKRALIAKNVEKGLLNEDKDNGIRLREKPEKEALQNYPKKIPQTQSSSDWEESGCGHPKGPNQRILRSLSEYCTQSVLVLRLCKLGT